MNRLFRARKTTINCSRLQLHSDVRNITLVAYLFYVTICLLNIHCHSVHAQYGMAVGDAPDVQIMNIGYSLYRRDGIIHTFPIDTWWDLLKQYRQTRPDHTDSRVTYHYWENEGADWISQLPCWVFPYDQSSDEHHNGLCQVSHDMNIRSVQIDVASVFTRSVLRRMIMRYIFSEFIPILYVIHTRNGNISDSFASLSAGLAFGTMDMGCTGRSGVKVLFVVFVTRMPVPIVIMMPANIRVILTTW